MLSSQVRTGLSTLSLIIHVTNFCKLGQILRQHNHASSAGTVTFYPYHLNIPPAVIALHLLVGFPYLPDWIRHVLRMKNLLSISGYGNCIEFFPAVVPSARLLWDIRIENRYCFTSIFSICSSTLFAFCGVQYKGQTSEGESGCTVKCSHVLINLLLHNFNGT